MTDGGGGKGIGICPGEMSGSPYMCQEAAAHPDIVDDTAHHDYSVASAVVGDKTKWAGSSVQVVEHKDMTI